MLSLVLLLCFIPEEPTHTDHIHGILTILDFVTLITAFGQQLRKSVQHIKGSNIGLGLVFLDQVKR